MRTVAVTDPTMAHALAVDRAKFWSHSFPGTPVRVYGTDQGLWFVDTLPDPVWGELTSIVDVYANGHTTPLPVLP